MSSVAHVSLPAQVARTKETSVFLATVKETSIMSTEAAAMKSAQRQLLPTWPPSNVSIADQTVRSVEPWKDPTASSA